MVALGSGRAIGHGNKLLWNIPADLKRFKQLTMGHPVIMGRKTFESILAHLGTPLPGRTNIVLTRDTSYAPQGALVVHSLEDALALASKQSGAEEIHIGGGAELYAQALPFVTRLYLTLIDAEKEADTFFPPYEQEFTKVLSDEPYEFNGLKYRFVTLERN